MVNKDLITNTNAQKINLNNLIDKNKLNESEHNKLILKLNNKMIL